MNVFILNTGRCGSLTFAKACRHITNYTSGHETRCDLTQSERLDYPDNHIEADNRLSWLLGRLDRKYGDEAVYVHLKRNREDTARSFMKRYPHSIVKAYRQAILMGSSEKPMSLCSDFCDTVESNIELFLKDKSNRMEFRIESAAEDFPLFWEMIGAEGDMNAAIAEFGIRYNASHPGKNRGNQQVMKPTGLLRKLKRIVANLPNYIRHG
jgi:hypothetical protein